MDIRRAIHRTVAHISGRFDGFEPSQKDFPLEDIPAVLATDCFDFAMVGTRSNGTTSPTLKLAGAPLDGPRHIWHVDPLHRPVWSLRVDT